MRTTPLGIVLVILHVTLCSSQSESNFLMYDKNVNKCLKGYQPLKLFYCDSNQLSQQFRWTSNDRILNVHLKKCLGAGSTADGSGLQWLICDDTSQLQKWECKNDTLLNLKGTNLFLSQDENSILKLTQDIGAASQWLTHGTTEGLCSRPYQELYTIGGNAFGRPCHFPFQYKGIWYSDCSLLESDEPWCSPDRDYQDMWGFCPTKSTENKLWKKNQLTGVFYQLNVGSALTWHQARRSCQQQDSDLLSITEPQEQSYLSGITTGTQTTFWIGLNQLDSESGWQWADGHPLRYLRWGSGQPNPALGWFCGSLNTMQSYHWENKLCSKKHGYICQKRTTDPATPGPPASCSAPWVPYADHCYFLNRTKKTWKDASIQCMRTGGHLVSVHEVEEQSFVLSQLGYMETDKLWVGLNDQKTQLLFEWSDQSPVTFTTWDTQEPSHHRTEEEDCVLMGGKDGKWSDSNCGENNGFVCKRAGDSNPASGSETENTGCKAAWTRYGYNCYLVGSTTKTFDEAKKSCQESGAHLIDIPNRVENAFLISLVGARPEKHFWIGLSNQRDIFEWTNTPKVPYTHWNARMPGQNQGCVAMTTGTLAGLWDVLSCSNKEKYICRQQAEGVVTTPAPPTSPPPSCAEGWSPLGARPFCYKLFVMDSKEERTWFEALHFCRSIGGDLMSIHSHLDDPESRYYFRSAWIGYSAQDPNVGYTWSDGSSSSYTKWMSGEPNNRNNMENCAGIENTNNWNDVACEKKMDFYCEIRKGVTPGVPNATIPQYNVTEDGWIEYSGHQYYISDGAMQMEDARKFCKKGHGDLVVINSEAERLFLWKQTQTEDDDFYIGLRIDLDKNTEWMDGTPVAFEGWDEDQPLFVVNDETCVKMSNSFGLWFVTNCGRRHEFICERHEAPAVNATLAPTEVSKGGCAPDWTKYKQHCYKTQFQKKNWTDAMSFCKAVGGDLVSVLSKDEQAFLTTMTADAQQHLWIGLHRLTDWSPVWSEGKMLTFRNFLKSNSWSWEGECFAMITNSRTSVGKWTTYECSQNMGFICKRPTDNQIIPQTTVLPLSYVEFGNDSLKVEPNNATWWEAKRRCEADGAQLASIRDGITQAYIELQINKLKQPVWIGLNKNETDGYFRWIDHWRLNRENWKYSEPKSQFPCVYVDLTGGWQTAPCNLSLPSVCKHSTDIAPTPHPQYPGLCPESWLPFKGHCYFLSSKEKGWPEASTACTILGASLLSIESSEEAKFINSLLEMVQDTYEAVWMGLYRNLKGQWHWLDRSVVDYTNWAEGQPREWSHNLMYAVISTSDLKWRSAWKYPYYPYICKKPKVPLPTVSTHEIPVLEVHRLYTGLVVAIMIAFTVMGFAAFFYYKGRKPVLPRMPAFENPLYFKSSKQDIPDDKNLIDSIEIDPCAS